MKVKRDGNHFRTTPISQQEDEEEEERDGRKVEKRLASKKWGAKEAKNKAHAHARILFFVYYNKKRLKVSALLHMSALGPPVSAWMASSQKKKK